MRKKLGNKLFSLVAFYFSGFIPPAIFHVFYVPYFHCINCINYHYSSSCRAASTNLPDPLVTRLYRPLLPEGLQGYTGWNDKFVVLKKQQDYSFILKLLLKKSIQATWLCSRTDIYSM